jgi:hypothetical protein
MFDFNFCVFAFIADDTLGCWLGQCYGVNTPLFMAVKTNSFFMVRK